MQIPRYPAHEDWIKWVGNSNHVHPVIVQNKCIAVSHSHSPVKWLRREPIPPVRSKERSSNWTIWIPDAYDAESIGSFTNIGIITVHNHRFGLAGQTRDSEGICLVADVENLETF